MKSPGLASAVSAALALLLGASALACGDEMSSTERAARGACTGLTPEDLRPAAVRVEFLKEKEQLAAQAANDDPRYDALYDARRDLRQATEDRDSKAALAQGLIIVRECRALGAG
jgi:hypothetical protein